MKLHKGGKSCSFNLHNFNQRRINKYWEVLLFWSYCSLNGERLNWRLIEGKQDTHFNQTASTQSSSLNLQEAPFWDTFSAAQMCLFISPKRCHHTEGGTCPTDSRAALQPLTVVKMCFSCVHAPCKSCRDVSNNYTIMGLIVLPAWTRSKVGSVSYIKGAWP